MFWHSETHSLERSQWGARRGETQRSLQSQDTQTQPSALQRRSQLLARRIWEIWQGGITPALEPKPRCFHELLMCIFSRQHRPQICFPRPQNISW